MSAAQRGAGPQPASEEADGRQYLSSCLDALSLHNSEQTANSEMMDAAEEICPVCKSSRYLNPNMRFLINPECYHKMCESCVDRIFSAGPAPCPVAGCHRTLRKNKFRKQTFEDMGVEREVDIRRTVMNMYASATNSNETTTNMHPSSLNRREAEFETLDDYNNFLEMREEMVCNLVYGTDVEKTQKFLRDYAKDHAENIAQNRTIESQTMASFAANQTAEQEAARLRREAARQEAESELRRIQAGKEDIISRLAAATSAEAEKITREGRVKLMRSSARSSEQDRLKQKQAALLADSSTGPASNKTSTPQPTTSSTATKIAGLKAAPAPTSPLGPYDPFNRADPTIAPDARSYYTLHESYPYPHLESARKNVRMQAGGYDLDEYHRRALLEAFAGLAVFVDDEVRERDLAGNGFGRDGMGGLSESIGAHSKGERVATAAAAKAAVSKGVPVNGDDVF